jgi:antitoxin MazE
MLHRKQTVKAWGNNLGVRLPADLVKEIHLLVNQQVSLSVQDGKIIIAPIPEDIHTLAQRLAAFEPALHRGEAMPVLENLGAEK